MDTTEVIEPIEPTSHEYLYDIPHDQLYAMFVSAVASLRADAQGLHCIEAERQALQRLSRTVQYQTAHAENGSRDQRIGALATLTLLLVTSRPSDENYADKLEAWYR